MSTRGKASLQRKKKRRRILAVGFVVVCLLIELLGYIPWLPFDGWQDVFTWFGLPQSHVIAEGELQVHFINVGNADCILVRQGESSLLIDAAESGNTAEILDYLKRHDVTKLDVVIATHPHADHIGSMAAVIDAISIDRFVMSYMPEGEEPTTKVYLSMLEALERNNVRVEEAEPGKTYKLGTARVQIVAPYSSDDAEGDANGISVVTRLTFGEHAFLFTGDAETEQEGRMLASRYDLDADVLKVAHHGSKTSSSAAFLRAVSPQYAVFTCGRNDYGHPSSEVLKRVEQVNAQIYRSDLHGDIVFVSDGQKLTVKTSEGD